MAETKEIGLICDYEFSSNGMINGVIPNKAFSNIANNYNPSNWDINRMAGYYYTRTLKKSVRMYTCDYARGNCNLGKVHSICLTGKILNTNFNLFHNYAGTGTIVVNSGSIVYTANQYCSITKTIPIGQDITLIIIRDNLKVWAYLNGENIGTFVPAGAWNSTNADFNSNNILKQWYGASEYSNFRIYNRVISEKEVKAYHNKWASKVVLKETFNYPVGATRFGNWVSPVVNSIKISEFTKADSVINSIVKGVKYVDCISGSGFRIPSTVAYGEWRWVFKYLTGSQTRIGFCCGNKLQYSPGLSVQILNGGILTLVNDGVAVVLQTASGYLNSGETYEFKVQRSTIGTVRIWVRGGKFGVNFKEISIVGGSGTYPYTNTTVTTSKWFNVTSYNIGNQFANLIIKQGITV